MVFWRLGWSEPDHHGAIGRFVLHSVTEDTTRSQGNAELGDQSPDAVVDLRRISVVPASGGRTRMALECLADTDDSR